MSEDISIFNRNNTGPMLWFHIIVQFNKDHNVKGSFLWESVWSEVSRIL